MMLTPPDDASSPNYLISSKLKRKIDPRSIIKLKKIENTVTEVDAADENSSHDTMNTTSHAYNYATSPDVENNISVR